MQHDIHMANPKNSKQIIIKENTFNELSTIKRVCGLKSMEATIRHLIEQNRRLKTVKDKEVDKEIEDAVKRYINQILGIDPYLIETMSPEQRSQHFFRNWDPKEKKDLEYLHLQHKCRIID